MVWCMGIAVVSAVILLLSKRFSMKQTTKKMLQILLLFALVGLALGYYEKTETLISEQDTIERNAFGEGDSHAALSLEVEGLLKDYPYDLEVPEAKITGKEEKEYLKKAQVEIDETFLGTNENLDCVRESVAILNQYQEGKVTAEWAFDDYQVVDESGQIQNENLPREGKLVQAEVTLTCGDSQEIYQFSFFAMPKELSQEEQLVAEVGDYIEQQKQERDSRSLQLPQSMSGYQLQWKQQNNYLPEKFLFLGLLLAAGVPIVELSKEREKQKKRETSLAIGYPDMVSKLSLLMGAGMTLYGGWKQICRTYESNQKKQKEKQPLYEEMCITWREIESGVGESTAYLRFGKRCGQRRYRKLANLLTQNLKKGTSGLLGLLEAEVEEAFEERKSIARKYGEEASTKLLLPMMIMLGIVILIIMVPAILSFQIG